MWGWDTILKAYIFIFGTPDVRSATLGTSGDTEMKEGTDSVLSQTFTRAICSFLSSLL